MLNVNKKSQIENIATKFLYDCMLCCLPELMHLFNLISDSGIFPDVWKHATIVPLFKAGDKKLVENYRPISLLPAIAKLFEKIIHRRIYTFLIETKYLTDAQCGFRPGLGTVDSLSKLLSNFYNNINLNNLCLTLFFDLKKAFDTIDHQILILKLYRLGISGISLDLIQNYLADRKQCCIELME